MRFKFFVITLFVGVIGYSALWFSAAGRLEDDLKAAKGPITDGGFRLDWDTLNIEGYPYRLEVHANGVQLRSKRRDVDIKARHLVAITHLWTPGHWVFDLQDVAASLPFLGRISDDTVIASLRKQSSGHSGIYIGGGEKTALKWNGIAVGLSWSLSLGLPATNNQSQQGGLYEDTKLLFVSKIGSSSRIFEAAGNVSAALPNNWTKESLAKWRDAGGLISFDRLSYSAGKDALSGNGSLSLDETLRPLGTVSLKGEAAGDLQALLVDLGFAEPEGNEATLMLQNGNLTIDGISVTRLRPVHR